MSAAASAKSSDTEIRVADTSASENLEGERKTVTVLFADLKGSMDLQERIDPEEARAIVDPALKLMIEAVHHYDGYVAQSTGDGIFALFGAPVAHEDDPQRALHAALRMQENLRRHFAKRPPSGEAPIEARVGVHTGEVVVRSLHTAEGHDEYVPVGHSIGLAARMQAFAPPGSIAVTESTRKLCEGYFNFRSLGPTKVKGVSETVYVHEVLGPGPLRTRLQRSAVRGLTPFVGRGDELLLLMNRWELAREGEGQVVLIVGEAGIGKSRLVRRFQERLSNSSFRWIQTEFSPYLQQTPFASTAEVIHQVFNWSGTESVEEKLERLDENVALAGLKAAEAVQLIAPLLNLPVPDKYPPLLLSPEQQRKRLLATLIGLLFSTTRAQPCVVVLEDLQWSDPSSLELQQLTVEQNATVPMLLLYSARPEFRAPWPMRAHHAQITLNRLNRSQAREMVTRVAAGDALPKDLLDIVVERAGGVPLFAEELTRAVLEGGTAEAVRAIPATLQHSLMARLDRLGPAKEVAQVASVIGREFSYELLHAVSTQTEDELQLALAKLTEAELIYTRGIPPQASYQFKHALVQDAAYEALLRSRRSLLHRRVAETLAEKFPVVADNQPELLARHWSGAGEPEQAIKQWSAAGESAQARGAFKEALKSSQQALALLVTLPESRERDFRELKLLQSMNHMLIVAGASAGEKLDATKRIGALAEKTGNLEQLTTGTVLRGITAFNAGDLAAAVTLADQGLDLALREGSPASLALAHHLQMQTRYRRGDLAGVEKHFARGSAFFDDPGLKEISSIVISYFGTASHNAWALGLSDVARERENHMMAAAAAKVSTPLEVAGSTYHAAQLRLYLREYRQAAALAARALELSDKHQLGLYGAVSKFILGEARAQLGHAAEGFRLIQRGVEDLLEAGSCLTVELATYLAAAQEHEDTIPHALATFEQALQANPDELVYRPEALRRRGELRVKQAQTELAQADFQEAVVLARRMGAKALELRASISLARLLAKQGRKDEGLLTLAVIYNWFTEGFDTVDLTEAKALFEELNNSA